MALDKFIVSVVAVVVIVSLLLLLLFGKQGGGQKECVCVVNAKGFNRFG